jgi:geranylgeranyl reductase family protein
MSEGTNQLEHDVVIVGASIAGCRTALTLAERGIRVLLLDKAEFPRWKPCAGGITLKARRYIPDPLFDLVETTIRGAYLTYGNEYVTHLQSSDPVGWMVHRETFDEAHLELARSQPTVDVMLGTTVREVLETPEHVCVATESGELKGKVLVGADGATGVVSRALPGHEDRLTGFAYEGETTLGDARITDDTLFDFQKFPGGYGWVFPKKDHYSVGGFVYGKGLPGVKELYQEFCRETPILRLAETYRARGHPIALGGNLRPLHTRRIALVGEAGDLVDPLTGEGIYYALRSGHVAGEAIAGFLGGDGALEVYGDRVREEIQKDLRLGRFLADWVYDHPRLAFHLMLRNSILCRLFAEIRAGTKTYMELVRGAAVSAPLLPFHAGLRKRKEVTVKIPRKWTAP